MQHLTQDLRTAGRLLVRNPGFTLLVSLTLALGIGASTAIFSVADGVLLTPLPYPQATRLMAIFSRFPALGFDHFWVSPPEYLELRQRATAFEDIGAYQIRSVNLEGDDQPVRVRAALASASLFQVLRVHASQGRFLSPQEDMPRVEPVAVLGEGLWRRGFAGDPDVVGKRVRIDGVPRTVVGVMPRGFDLANQHVEVWLPLALDPAKLQRGNHVLNLVGRLRAGATLAQARSEMEGLLARWKRELPDVHTLDPQQHRLVIVPLLDDVVGDMRGKILVLAAAVAMVLLVACLNVANLLLVRAEARQLEIVVRTALGAQRSQLLRQFLAEGMLLSLLAGGLGLLLALAGLRTLVAVNAEGIPRVEEIGVDARAVAFTLALSLLTGLLFALAPAFHVRGKFLFSAFREGAGTPRAAAAWFRRALVVVEIALATLLTIGAGLMMKSFLTLQQVDPGFEPRGLLTLQVSLPRASYPDPHGVLAFYRGLIARVAALPGVESAATVSGLPPKREVDSNDLLFEHIAPAPGGPPQHVDYIPFVSRDYFRTMRIPLLAGRTFNASDDEETLPVVVINQTMARTFWPDRSPLGDRVRPPGSSPWFTIVGVVADVKQNGLDHPAGTELYVLQDQLPARTLYLVVRTRRAPMGEASAVLAEVHRLDPSLPTAQARSMEEVMLGSVARPRLLMALVLAFASVVLTLAAVGTYSVLSYSVAQRTREIGVRMALGAQSGQVLSMVLGQGARLAGLGLVLGIAGALALRRLLLSLLFGVAPADPAIFGTVVTILALMAFVASYLPARRASGIDPLTALR